MQRYRINYRWLIGVFVGSLMLAVTTFFIQRWQVSRKAGYFLTLAEAALAEDNALDAFGYFRKYVQLREDEDEARIKMANAAVVVTKDPDIKFEERMLAFGTLDQAVRTTDDDGLRRELAEIMMMFRRPQDAIGHLEDLLAVTPNDPELNAILVRALFQAKDKRVKEKALNFIGYDKKTDAFDPDKALLKGEPDVYALLSEVLLLKGKNKELARRVIDEMVANNPDSPQAHLRKSVFLSSLRENDAAAESLDKAYELDPKDAAILSRKGMIALSGSNYEVAKSTYLEVMSSFEEALSEATPSAASALADSNYYAIKAAYHAAISNYEKARPNFEEAVANLDAARSNYEEALSKLSPESLDVPDDSNYQEALAKLNDAKQTFEKSLPNFKAAKAYFTTGLQEHPDNVLFCRLMAEAENRLGQAEAAMKILDEGIIKFEKRQSIDLVIYKIDLLIADEDYSGVDREIKRIVQLNRPSLQPIVDFQKARLSFRKKKWAECARELKRIRPLLFDRPQFQVLAGTMLGICYERQGIPDLALRAYNAVLTDYPEHASALAGRERTMVRLQTKPEAIELDQVVNNTLELPEAEQDWTKVNELVEKAIKEQGLGIGQAKLLRAKVLIKRGVFAPAKDLIRQAAKDAPDDINVHFAAVMLVLSNPEQGVVPAMKLHDRLEERWGVSLRSVAQHAELLYELHPEDLSEQLRSLMTAIKDITPNDTQRLYKILGLKFEQLGKIDDAREFYEKSAVTEPNNLPIRMHLFELALRQRDDAAMEKAQEGVLDLVKSKNDASYILTDVKRRFASFSRQEIDQSELSKARERLDTALIQRPKWHELHVAYGQLELFLGGSIDQALKHFDTALDSGPAKSHAVSIQVKLLAKRGLYARARERMELLRRGIRPNLLGKIEAEVLVRTGDSDAGFAAAEKIAASQPNNPAIQVWYSRIAQEIGKLDVAATALRRAIEKNASSPDNWMRLIGLYTEQKNFEEVQSVIREAHLASEAEFLPLLTGKYYEMVSRWQNAESIYLASYADQLDRVSVSHRLADFYLLWSIKDPANFGKAAVYINRILRAANNGEVDANDPHVVWARQKAARLLSANQDYQQSLKAERLLRESSVNNVMSDEEFELLIDILISRGDPKSLLQAKQLLSEQRTNGRLQIKGGLQLARIINQTDGWNEANSLMLELLAQNKSDPAVQTTYIELLIGKGEFSRAESGIKRLADSAPRNKSLVQLSARLAAERGDQAELNRLLTSLLPKMGGALSKGQLEKIHGIAQLANRYGANELASKLYEIYVDRVPAQAYVLAKFLANHGDCDRALEIMKRLYPDQTDQIIQLASRMVSVRRNEIGDKYDEAVDRLIDSALQEDPDSVSRQLVRAETYDAQGKHEDSVATYDRLLQRDDLPTRLRAAAMNNLGFQLGLLSQRVDEAERLINEAMETFGPVADMLDTRAIVRIAQKKYDLAIEDMQLAVSVSQDPVKYFHMAKACILAGDGPAAMQAWEKAQELGFEKDSLPILEKSTFDQILQQIESFQTQNAKL